MMDFFSQMMNFFDYVIPLADWIDLIVDWLTIEGSAFFRAISDFLRIQLLRIEHVLLWLPWPVMVGIFAVLGWRTAGWRMGVGVVLGFLFIGFLGLWTLAMETLGLVVAATVLAVIVAIPTGIALARSNLLDTLMRPVLDLLQTMPSFVYLIPALMLFGLGRVPALMATFIYAVPPAIRLTNLAIRQVPREIIEAGRAFGSTPNQLLVKVQLPLALPTIMAGINQTIMMALAMVVIASLVGARGLGLEVLNGIARLEVGRGFVAGLAIVILAIVIDRITQNLVKTRPVSAD